MGVRETTLRQFHRTKAFTYEPKITSDWDGTIRDGTCRDVMWLKKVQHKDFAEKPNVPEPGKRESWHKVKREIHDPEHVGASKITTCSPYGKWPNYKVTRDHSHLKNGMVDKKYSRSGFLVQPERIDSISPRNDASISPRISPLC